MCKKAKPITDKVYLALAHLDMGLSSDEDLNTLRKSLQELVAELFELLYPGS